MNTVEQLILVVRYPLRNVLTSQPYYIYIFPLNDHYQHKLDI